MCLNAGDCTSEIHFRYFEVDYYIADKETVFVFRIYVCLFNTSGLISCNINEFVALKWQYFKMCFSLFLKNWKGQVKNHGLRDRVNRPGRSRVQDWFLNYSTYGAGRPKRFVSKLKIQPSPHFCFFFHKIFNVYVRRNLRPRVR